MQAVKPSFSTFSIQALYLLKDVAEVLPVKSREFKSEESWLLKHSQSSLCNLSELALGASHAKFSTLTHKRMCTISSEISDLGLMRKSGHTSQGSESGNPSGSFIWLKLDSAQTLLHRKVSLNNPSWLLPCSHIIRRRFQNCSSST